MNLIYPVGTNHWVSQTYAEHVARAKANGWCHKPGNCPGGVWYFGGIDWACPTGTPVYAAAAGRCEVQNQGSAGYGNNVRITHKDGYYTIYAHLQKAMVVTGLDAMQGDLIGYSDNTGNSTGPHIHFELRKNGVPLDPMQFLTTDTQPPAPPTAFVPPSIPALSLVRVTKAIGSYLNVRMLPVSGKVIGKLYAGDVVPVFSIAQDKANYWYAVILPDNTLGWTAGYYNGEVWLENV